MERKEFLKLMALAGVGTPFLLNGMPSRAMNYFLDMQTSSCDDVNDRVLVILRLAGANDGLNTVIPVSQYTTYAALRPTIKIKETGSGSFIPLDSTVSQSKLVGLHPSMTGFKMLYDEGKLSLFNGVGYPTPNYSHFRSENLMFSGKDGSNNQDLEDGMFGRYLGALHPGLSGHPTVQRPDPLAIQLGNLNPSLFYEHHTEKNIEYNLSGFQNTLFNSLKTVDPNSEYNDLIAYIKQVALSMDAYYNRIMAVFNAGMNSATTYPDNTLGKQLKTVARMIKGGSKTKIFQVNIGGFDTHVNQIQSGNTELGAHANLLATISNGIAAFQKDLNLMGIGDRVLTATFSEFGRQVRENASVGTDHGDLAPFFVVGNSVTPGIFGDHPVFTNSTNYYYNQNQRRFDYRQIFASILQDWLGATDTLMFEAQLNNFVTVDNKINIIAPSQVASVLCPNTTLSTNNAQQKAVSIYPNPASDFANVDLSALNFKNAEVKIYEASGKIVLSKSYSNEHKIIRLDVSHFKSGLYIININLDGEKRLEKLIIK